MYYKELYVPNESKPFPAMIRNYREEDFAELIRIQKECFPPPFPEELWWNIKTAILLYVICYINKIMGNL